MTVRLTGMGKICEYVDRSECTLMDWIQNWGFPAYKVDGGIWEGLTDKIDIWLEEHIPPPKKKVKLVARW